MSKPESENQERGHLQHAAEHEKPQKRNPVLLYLTILFAAAFLLLLMSLLMQRRANQEALNNLQQTSSSATQTLENTIRQNEALTKQVEDLEQAVSQNQQTIREQEDRLDEQEDQLYALSQASPWTGSGRSTRPMSGAVTAWPAVSSRTWENSFPWPSPGRASPTMTVSPPTTAIRRSITPCTDSKG